MPVTLRATSGNVIVSSTADVVTIRDVRCPDITLSISADALGDTILALAALHLRANRDAACHFIGDSGL